MEILIQYALSFVGNPYKWGGDDPIDGFDCSGLIQELLASVGLDPSGDQTAQGLFNYFQAGNGSWNDYSAGSLAFYGESVTKITHVAMLLDQFRIIEAGGGGHTCTNREMAAKLNAYVRIRLVKKRGDLVAVIKPYYRTIGVI